MKKIIGVFCLLLVLTMLAIPAMAVSGSVSLSASSKNLNLGDTFTISAKLSSSDAIALGTVVLSYDSSVFEMTGGSCNVSGVSIGQVIPGNNAGTFMFSGDPRVVSGTIFTFNMKVKDTAAVGSHTISSASSIGVGNGEGISSGSVTVTIVCKHTYGEWVDAGENHTQTCSKCGAVNSEAHKWNKGTVTQQPTCSDEGVKTFTCSTCKATKTESIAATGKHTFGNLTPVDDYSHKDTCSTCNQTVTEAHTWNKGTVTQQPTCSEEGVKTLTCTGCKHTKTEPVPATGKHSFGNLTPVDNYSHTDTCSTCNQSIIEAHTWNKGTVTKKPTCLEEGEKTYTCTGCRHTKVEKIARLTTHSWGRWKKVDSYYHERTCSVCSVTESGRHSYSTTWGKDKYNHYHECSVCKDQINVEPHIPGPKATEDTPQLCTVCRYVITPALRHTHDYETNWISDENGHWFACSGCEEKVAYVAHSFDNACDPECAECGYVRETTHDYGDRWSTDSTTHYHQCIHCDDIQDQDVHIPGAPATRESAQTCTICGYELAPALTAADVAAQATGTVSRIVVLILGLAAGAAAIAIIAIVVIVSLVKKKKR